MAEACRNLAAVGAEPIGVTDCLNFGDPEKPHVQYELTEGIAGIRDACDAFGIPVVSGNVSLYNESAGRSIYPTPVIGALGLLPDVTRHATAGFKHAGDVVYLMGANSLDRPASDLGGSEFLAQVHGQVKGRPSIDLELEVRVQKACREAIRAGLVASAHDCADGGFAVTLAESAILGGLGVQVDLAIPERWDASLFAEVQSRILVSVPPKRAARFEQLCGEHQVPAIPVGVVGGAHIRIGGRVNVDLSTAADAWENGLARALVHPATG